jgi:AcrR family transcriptional regulator
VAISVVLYHFANKDELVKAIVIELYRSFTAMMAPALQAERSRERS